MKWFLLVAAAALTTAMPGYAQESGAATTPTTSSGPAQTVEGAQEFLRLITLQFPFVSSDIAKADFYARSINIRFEPVGPCDSLITRDFEWRIGDSQSSPGLGAEANLDGYIAAWLRNYSVTDVTTAADYRKTLSTALMPAAVNWSSVSSIKTFKANSNETTERAVVVTAQPASVVLVTPDAATAARVAYAMEFLRSACDLSASTGF
ncbi:MAG: hypothetical protein EAY70_11005 [Sphingomonadales bacterium]|nr:MAG: hypothetical protein EAY70_11005 [Sphingomonadales bacterium]